MTFSRKFALLALCSLLVWGLTFSAKAQSASDKKKSVLASVRRIAVLLPYFGTPEFLDHAPLKPESSRRRPTGDELRQRSESRTFLAKLETETQRILQERLKERTPFTFVPLTAEPPFPENKKEAVLLPSVFPLKNEGRLKGTKFPLPDPDAVKRIAVQNGTDAVLLTVMDEPRRDGGGYFFDVSGVGYRSPHVSGKIAFYLLSKDGSEILHEFVEVLHPVTKIGNRDYTQVDMTETHEQIIENFLDELSRYLPRTALLF